MHIHHIDICLCLAKFLYLIVFLHILHVFGLQELIGTVEVMEKNQLYNFLVLKCETQDEGETAVLCTLEYGDLTRCLPTNVTIKSESKTFYVALMAVMLANQILKFNGHLQSIQITNLSASVKSYLSFDNIKF